MEEIHSHCSQPSSVTALRTCVCMLTCLLACVLACLRPYIVNFKLENVEHFGVEPEQAATADLLFCHGAGFVRGTKPSPEMNTSITRASVAVIPIPPVVEKTSGENDPCSISLILWS